MRLVLEKNLYYIVPLSIFFIICFVLVISFNKETILILSNSGMHPYFDLFFKNVTYLGGEYFFVIIVILLSLYSFKKAFILSFSGMVTSIIVYTSKIIFNCSRPLKYFQENDLNMDLLHLVQGVEMKFIHSFPSGHASRTFCIFLMLAIFSKNKVYKFLFFLISVISGYSRMYLYQHFLEDVFVGAMVGSFVSFISYSVLHNSKLLEKRIFKKSLLKL